VLPWRARSAGRWPGGAGLEEEGVGLESTRGRRGVAVRRGLVTGGRRGGKIKEKKKRKEEKTKEEKKRKIEIGREKEIEKREKK
jgi:hypothetical protein